MNVAHTVFHTCPLLLCMLLRWNKNVSKYVWVSDCKDGRVCCSTCKQWPVFLLCRCAYADYIKYQTDLRRCSGSCEKYLDSGRSQISIPAVFYLDCLQFRKPNVKVERPFALLTAEKKEMLWPVKYPSPDCFGIRPVDCQGRSDRISSVPYSGRFLWGSQKKTSDFAVEVWQRICKMQILCHIKKKRYKLKTT